MSAGNRWRLLAACQSVMKRLLLLVGSHPTANHLLPTRGNLEGTCTRFKASMLTGIAGINRQSAHPQPRAGWQPVCRYLVAAAQAQGLQLWQACGNCADTAKFRAENSNALPCCSLESTLRPGCKIHWGRPVLVWAPLETGCALGYCRCPASDCCRSYSLAVSQQHLVTDTTAGSGLSGCTYLRGCVGTMSRRCAASARR